jgi:tRNA (5-methylaminomethyl-2-thiouridylate)-methyltransferase
MKIIAGLSGGVDSSVAALLLKNEGHAVTGVTMRIWRDGHYAGGDKDACFGPGEADDVAAAAGFCRQFGIGYQTFDCSEAYENAIVSYYREEHLAGRTPNPCVRCNALMKFGLLPKLAAEAGLEFDRFATGHYARVDALGEGGRFRLLRAADRFKDQSYFLHRLSQSQLARQLFPIGHLTKPEVRRLARELGVAAADKPDSQDFYSGERGELIGAPDREGDIVDEAGAVVGKHTGFWKYTIGQRKGLGVSHPRPLYVVALEACRNRVVVAEAERAVRTTLAAMGCNWVSIPEPDAVENIQMKVRSGGDPHPNVSLRNLGGGKVRADFPDGIAGIAPGQSAVFYDGDAVLGGGVITE